jgi:hypothetical protein
MLSSIVFLSLVLGIIPGLGAGVQLPPSISDHYTFKNIDFPDKPNHAVKTTHADAINNPRQVVGFFVEKPTPLGDGKQHGFLLAGGSYSAFDVEVPAASSAAVKANFTAALGISNRHKAAAVALPPGTGDPVAISELAWKWDIVGVYQDSALKIHGFILAGGQFKTIDAGKLAPIDAGPSPVITTPLSLKISNVVATSARGLGAATPRSSSAPPRPADIVGWYQDLTIPFIHGFLMSGDKVCSLDAKGAVRTKASGINRHRHIVGYFISLDPLPTAHGFLFVPAGRPDETPADACKGKFFGKDVSGASGTVYRGINSRDDIVGFYRDTATPRRMTHGLLIKKGKFFTVDATSLGAIRTEASGINDRGDIVGLYVDGNNNTHAFLATPHHPEPPDEGGD